METLILTAFICQLLSLAVGSPLIASARNIQPSLRTEILEPNPEAFSQYVHHFRDIATSLGVPEDTSVIIKDFFSRSLLDLERIAETHNAYIYNRTFSGNAIVINGSTLNRSSQFYDFLDRIEKSKGGTQPVSVYDNWSELKNYINDGYSKDTEIESFEYVIHTQNIGESQLSAQAFWTRVRQHGNQPPEVKNGNKKFLVNFGEQSSSQTVPLPPAIHSQFANVHQPPNYAAYNPIVKENFYEQKATDHGPVFYITHVFITPLKLEPTPGTADDLLPKDTPEVAILKAQHLALKQHFEAVISNLTQQSKNSA